MTATLLWDEITKGENGFPVRTPKEYEVYAKEKSVNRAETYDAMRTGIEATIILEVRQEDWEMTAHLVDGRKKYPRKVRHDGSEYDIVRTWKRGKATIELTCG